MLAHTTSGCAQVYPRRKVAGVGASQMSTGPVHVSREALEELFELPLRTAAERLVRTVSQVSRTRCFSKAPPNCSISAYSGGA
jgi:hypothetical protein